VARLRIPAVLAVALIGGTTIGIVAASCGGGESPPECQADAGTCPGDGRICLDEATGIDPCCPVCPVNGTCPDGCVLQLPPI
jgi:hypothetical protein